MAPPRHASFLPLTVPDFLQLDGLAKRFGNHVAVAALDLGVRRGELVAFLGPSGCGKTTTLRMVAGLVPPSAGRIVLDGHDMTDVPTYRRNMGLVFQSYALFPHMTVAQNIAFGLRMRRLPKAEIARAVAEAVALVRLQGLEERRPRDLSGGQQQRVALARAVVTNPSLLLLDEPLSNLDAKLRDGLRAELRELQQRLGITAIFVTHDQAEALAICDRVAVMHDGRLEQIATPMEIYEKPATPFVASFVGRVNRIPATVGADGRLDTALGPLRASALPAPGKAEVMIRPHRIRLASSASPADNSVNGQVARIIYVGDIVQYEIAAGDLLLAVERPTAAAEPPLPPGTAVTLGWGAADTLVFGA